MSFEAFLGIGVSHADVIDEQSYTLFEKFHPNAVTLERAMHFFDERGAREEKPRRARFYRGESNISWVDQRGTSKIRHCNQATPIIFQNVRQTLLYVDDIALISPDSIDIFGATRYCRDHRVPLYFVDIPLNNWDYVQFNNNDYRIIRGKNKRKHTEHYGLHNIQGIHESGGLELEIRNKFAADAINWIGKRAHRVAHVGGLGHFNVQCFKTESGAWEPYASEYKMHLQDFLNAQKMYIADTTKQDALYTFDRKNNKMHRVQKDSNEF